MVKIKKIMCVSLTLLVLVSIFSTFALASYSEPVSLYVFICPNCNEKMRYHIIIPNYTDRLVGSCEHGDHYYAERGSQWVCDYCKFIFRTDIEEGHYCTGEGGHYCWTECDCEDRA